MRELRSKGSWSRSKVEGRIPPLGNESEMRLQELVTDGVAHLVGDALSGYDWVLECCGHALRFLAERLRSLSPGGERGLVVGEIL